MIKKLMMHIWSTTPAVSDNIKQLQDKVNELVDKLNSIEQQKIDEENQMIKHDKLFEDLQGDY
jgi:hypothetical protein